MPAAQAVLLLSRPDCYIRISSSGNCLLPQERLSTVAPRVNSPDTQRLQIAVTCEVAASDLPPLQSSDIGMPAKVSTGHVHKRTARPAAKRAFDQGSRFVPCPLCNANLAWHNINTHLDTVHPTSLSTSSVQCSPRSSRLPHPADTCKPDGQLKFRSAESEASSHTSGTSAQHTAVLPATNHGNTSSPTLAWWQRPPPHTLASAKLASSRQATPVTDDELRSLTPCEVVRDALPVPLANRLLKLLLADCATWTRGTWYMGGKEHAAPRTSAYYTLDSLQEVSPTAGANNQALDVSSSVDKRAAPKDLQAASAILSAHVNRLMPRVGDKLAFEDREGWHASYALCNMYQDGDQGVGPHADRLTMLGPRPVIASLSLGATRTFRLRCMAKQDTQQHASQSGQHHMHRQLDMSTETQHQASIDNDTATISGAQPPRLTTLWLRHSQQRQSNNGMIFPEVTSEEPLAQPVTLQSKLPAAAQHEVAANAQQPRGDSQGPVSSADVLLPHNTLVIMWPPMQEAWKHEIPKCKNVTKHPIAGTARINLTFRQLKPGWVEKAPCCRCGQKAVMKASLPSSAAHTQRYYYTCDNTKGPGCGFFLKAQVCV